jgi:hypothetical protein
MLTEQGRELIESHHESDQVDSRHASGDKQAAQPVIGRLEPSKSGELQHLFARPMPVMQI